MADNTTLNSGSGGDTIRTEDRTTYKTPVSLIDVGGTASEKLLGDSGGFLPLANTVKDGTGTFYAPLVDADGHFQIDVLSCASHAVTNAGTFAVQAAQSGAWSVTGTLAASTATIGTVKLTDGTETVDVTTSNRLAVSLRSDVTYGTQGVTLAGGRYVDIFPNLSTGESAFLRLNLNGLLKTEATLVASTVALGTIKITDGTETAAVTTSNRLTVDGSGVTQPVSGTVTATLSASTTRVGSVQITDGTSTADVTTGNRLAVDGSGVTQPISGTVTANAGSGTFTVSDSTVQTNTTDIPNVIGTDGAAGPSKAISIGGTDGSGNLQEIVTDTDGHLQVDVLSGGGGGTQYTEGNTDASITGTAMMMEGAADTLVAAQGTAADGLLVNLGSNNDVTVTGTVTANAGTGTFTVDGSAVTQPISAASLPLPSGAATAANQTTIIGHVDGLEGLLTTIDADTSTLSGAVSGTEMQVDVVASLPAGTNAIGKLAANSGVDIGDVDILSIAAGSNLIGNVGIGVRTSGGATPYYNNGTASKTSIKASAGQIYGILATNLKASVVYLQLFNATTGSVTLGTTTPTMEFAIPTQGDTNGAGFSLPMPMGFAFGTAITYAITTTKGGATPISANECILNVGYA